MSIITIIIIIIVSVSNFHLMFGVQTAASVQVAFGPGVMPSTSLKVYGAAKEGNVGKSSASDPKSSDNGETLLSLTSAANEDGNDAFSADPTKTSAQIVKKEYREPWVRNCC